MMKKKRMVGALAALVIAAGGFGAYSFMAKGQVASIVLLDVNPSIELRVDSDEDIIEARALNSDAEKVLKGMKLKGADVDTAVNAIVGSLLKNGYIDELANSILVSVEDKDAVRGEKLQQELSEEINQILGATAINAAVLSQYMDGELTEEVADEFDISKGKAELIQNIVKVNEAYSLQELAKLSVNELNLILSNSKNENVDVVSKGTASENGYIGHEEAKKIALAHAGVKESDTRDMDVEFDYEYGKMIYEVEFDAAEYEYDYSVDAVKGEILHSHREYDEDYVPVKENTTKPTENKTENTTKPTENKTENTTKPVEDKTTDIGKEKAKAIALKHAGLKESEVKGLRVECDRDDGRVEYNVEFYIGNKEYDYEISAETGKILDYDVDVDDDDDDRKVNANTNTNTTKPAEDKVTDIGKAKAKSIALKHAGLSESQVTHLQVERDVDDGKVEYSVEFKANGKEYDYEIAGASGKITDYDIETEDDD